MFNNILTFHNMSCNTWDSTLIHPKIPVEPFARQYIDICGKLNRKAIQLQIQILIPQEKQTLEHQFQATSFPISSSWYFLLLHQSLFHILSKLEMNKYCPCKATSKNYSSCNKRDLKLFTLGCRYLPVICWKQSSFPIRNTIVRLVIIVIK